MLDLKTAGPFLRILPSKDYQTYMINNNDNSSSSHATTATSPQTYQSTIPETVDHPNKEEGFNQVTRKGKKISLQNQQQPQRKQ